MEWTEDEINLLKSVYRVVSRDKLIELFHPRKLSAIRKKANSIGLVSAHRWTKSEDDILIQAYRQLDISKLTDIFPHRTREAIYSRAEFLDLPNRHYVNVRNSRNDRVPVFLDGLSDFDLGYLAGLVDGEGYIGIQKTSRKKKNGEISFCYHMKVEIANTDRSMIDWLFQKIPNARPYITCQTTSKRKTAYHWTILGPRRVMQFLKEIAPYLVVKRQIAERLSNGYIHLDDAGRAELHDFVKNFNKNGNE